MKKYRWNGGGMGVKKGSGFLARTPGDKGGRSGAYQDKKIVVSKTGETPLRWSHDNSNSKRRGKDYCKAKTREKDERGDGKKGEGRKRGEKNKLEDSVQNGTCGGGWQEMASWRGETRGPILWESTKGGTGGCKKLLVCGKTGKRKCKLQGSLTWRNEGKGRWKRRGRKRKKGTDVGKWSDLASMGGGGGSQTKSWGCWERKPRGGEGEKGLQPSA